MSKALDNVRKLNDILSITEFGAVGDGAQSSATANVTAIRAAIAAASASDKALYIPSGTFVVNDNFRLTSANNGLTIFGDGFESCIKLANATNTGINVVAGWMFQIEDASATIKNITIRDLQLDGSRATTTHNTTSFGVRIGDGAPPVEAALENVLVQNVWAHSFKQGEGLRTSNGGVRFNNVFCYNNEFHGIGVANVIGTPFDGYVQIDNATCYDNDAYGIDISKGKAIIGVAECFRNTAGGMKTSVDCEYMLADQLIMYDNTGLGYQCTGTAPNLEIIINFIEAKNNGSNGIRIAHGKSVHIGTARCTSNSANEPFPTDVYLTSIGDQTEINIDNLYIVNSIKYGLQIDTLQRNLRIGYLEARDCQDTVVRVLVGVKQFVLNSGLFVNNNKIGSTGINAVALFVNSETAVLENLVFQDTQGAPTQVSGMWIANGCKAWVNGCRFGTGIIAGQQVYATIAGTHVRFGRGNTGVVTYARGTYVADGGATTHTVTFPTALSALNVSTLFGQMTPASQDASGAHWINTVSTTQLRVDYASATPAGTNNVSYRYEAELEMIV